MIRQHGQMHALLGQTHDLKVVSLSVGVEASLFGDPPDRQGRFFLRQKRKHSAILGWQFVEWSDIYSLILD